MNEHWSYVKSNIDSFPEYKSSIFEKGFFITNQKIEFDGSFPFYNYWREEVLTDEINAYIHIRQKIYTYKSEDSVFFLIGHAYNPFTYQADETEILKDIAITSRNDKNIILDKINELTGIFLFGVINKDDIIACSDFSSYYAAYYGVIGDHWYISSHEEIVAYYESITRDPYVNRLEKYKWYYLFGEGLPGDISHYLELKKLTSNSYISIKNNTFKLTRFFPNEPIVMCDNRDDYNAVVEQVAEIMKRSLELTAIKWNRAAVSTTGGKDSKGTLAAASHLGNKLQYFSYNSQYAEKVDCIAAEKLCEIIGVKHTTYDIPLEKDIYPEYDIVKAILHINSNRKKFNHNDIMKRIYFKRGDLFDVEIKSWASEIGCSCYHKKHGVNILQKKITPRKVNMLNNIFLFNPFLMYQTDKKYKEYLLKTELAKKIFNYEWADIMRIEQKHGRWGTDVITCEHMFAYEVTIPCNNRSLGKLFLKVPLEDRIRKKTHNDFTYLLCPDIINSGINVINYAHNKRRSLLEKIYYYVACKRIV